jgi:DUF971 family protein
MSSIRPTAIDGDRLKRKLTISWSDGHLSEYSFSLLRHACPCAECRGGHEQMRTEPDAEVFFMPEEDSPATRLKDIQAAGTYAVILDWEDGHHFGIYTWHYLRRLCPCDQCRGDYIVENSSQR